jgi:2-polyprenyl-3-methyl-5-hydroxy-6-metoxy-1,4-benzoquinol methylase
LNDFDRKARDREREASRLERALQASRAIRDTVPVAGRRILDYGCGTGLLGLALQPQAARVTLADASEGMLQVVRERIAATEATNLEALKLDLQVDPPPDERYGLICSLLTLHHVPDTLDILRKFHGLLEPGGWVALLDLEQEDGSFHGPEMAVHHGFDPGAFCRDLDRAGFRQISLGRPFDIQLPPERGGGRYPTFLAAGRRD